MKNENDSYDKTKQCRNQIPSIGTIIALVFLTLVLLAGCGTKKVYIPIERKVTETVTLRDTLVKMELAHYRDTVSITVEAGKDTASFLQNPYAYSYASFIAGIFSHSLGIKKGAYSEGKVQVKEVHVVDSIPYPVEVKGDTVTVYKLRWWEKYFVWCGVAANVLALLYIGKRRSKG